jgi:hypothetical protein
LGFRAKDIVRRVGSQAGDGAVQRETQVGTGTEGRGTEEEEMGGREAWGAPGNVRSLNFQHPRLI